MLLHMNKETTYTIYHSPDADDAFMFYGLACGAVKISGYNFGHELKDIESLNHLAREKAVEISAVSVHTLPYIADNYAVLRYGASMGGKDYGPRLLTKSGKTISSGMKVALPGVLTSAALAFRIYALENKLTFEEVITPFESIMDEIQAGRVDAGVIIHEGQLTFPEQGLSCAVDLGEWWWKKTNLPLPLGINVVRKDLGPGVIEAVQEVFRRSIEYGLEHREGALKYAAQFGRGLSLKTLDTFVAMYVNERTRNLGKEGMEAIKLFLSTGEHYSLIPNNFEIEFV